MKKYTNKILIIVAALFLVAHTILFFIKASEVNTEIHQLEINK